MKYAISILDGLLDMFCLIVMYNCILRDRKKNIPGILFLGGFVLAEGLLIVNLFFIQTDSAVSTLITTSLSLTTAFLLTFYYSAHLTQRVFCVLVFQVYAVLGESGFSILLTMLYPNIHAASDLFFNITVSLGSKSIIFLLILITKSIWERRFLQYPLHYNLPLLFTPVITILILYASIPAMPSSYNISHYVFLIFCLLILNFINYYLLSKTSQSTYQRDQLTAMNQQIALQKSRFEQLTSAYRTMQSVVHDIRKHYIYIESCVQKGDYDKLLEYLHHSMYVLSSHYVKFHTDNLVIDSFMNAYQEIANRDHIRFETDLDFDNNRTKRIDDYDLCVVIGNLLDNSLNACRLIPSFEDRFIMITILTDDHHFSIRFENPSVPKAIVKKDAISNLYHGYGLNNVEAIVHKYQGVFIKSEKTTFSAMCIFPQCDLIL